MVNVAIDSNVLAFAEGVMAWCDAFPLIESTNDVMLAARCRLLLSEDLQDGFTWRGVTVTNPFGPAPHPLLRALTG